MKAFCLAAVPFLLLGVSASTFAQGPSQIELKVEPSNRTLSINADDEVSVDPEVAILHIGFETSITDAKSAYAEGSRTSNAIIAALKQAGIPDTAIHSEYQQIEPALPAKQHKFKLIQSWTVKTPPERVAEILDVAVTAGATDSGNIEWTVKDEKALETEALKKAAARARSQAAELAQAMGVRLGALIYTTNQVSGGIRPIAYARAMKMSAGVVADQPLSIEPHKVTRSATVYAVYSIE